MKTLHSYNAIYYTWGINTCTSQCTPNAGSGIQSFVRMLNFIGCGLKKYIKRSRDCLLYTKKDINCDLFADKITACTTFTSRENVLNTNGYFYLPCIFYEWKYTITWLLWNAMSRDANIEIKLPYFRSDRLQSTKTNSISDRNVRELPYFIFDAGSVVFN